MCLARLTRGSNIPLWYTQRLTPCFLVSKIISSHSSVVNAIGFSNRRMGYPNLAISKAFGHALKQVRIHPQGLDL